MPSLTGGLTDSTVDNNSTSEPYVPHLPVDMRDNPVNSLGSWHKIRAACCEDPGTYHSAIAARYLHWFFESDNSWLTQDLHSKWSGWLVEDGAPARLDDWQPWSASLDMELFPVVRWFMGGNTNAAFNEIDRHVIAGQGNEPALYFEGYAWDGAAFGGLGRPVVEKAISRKQLLTESVVAALALESLGLKKGDRIALLLPNVPEQIFWIEAAKRSGIIYVPLPLDITSHALSECLFDSGAKVLITADGAVRNGNEYNLKSQVVEQALSDYVLLSEALTVVEKIVGRYFADTSARKICRRIKEDFSDVVTIKTSELIHKTLEKTFAFDGSDVPVSVDLRIALNEGLQELTGSVGSVVVVRHLSSEMPEMVDGRDIWANDLLAQAHDSLLKTICLSSIDELLHLPGNDLVSTLWRVCPCEPVESSFPLFIMYQFTEEGVGKGIVHTHAGYLSGAMLTLKACFDPQVGKDVIWVLTDPSEIAGQSYMISGALGLRIPTMIVEGVPLEDKPERIASVIYRRQISILIGDVKSLRGLVKDKAAMAMVEQFDLSCLKAGAFLDSNVSLDIQRLAMERLTPVFMTTRSCKEAGGIVFGHFYGNPDLRLKVDGHQYPLPWVVEEVRSVNDMPDRHERYRYQIVQGNEWGGLVFTAPFPSRVHTFWGRKESVANETWAGDIRSFNRCYFDRFCDQEGKADRAFFYGDLASNEGEKGYLLQTVSNQLIETENGTLNARVIETAILEHDAKNGALIDACMVVSFVNSLEEQCCIALVVTSNGKDLGAGQVEEINSRLINKTGIHAVPYCYLRVKSIPVIAGGQYAYAWVEALINGEHFSDYDCSWAEPTFLEQIRQLQSKGTVHQSDASYVRIGGVRVYFYMLDIRSGNDHVIASIVIDRSPVNAISTSLMRDMEKALDITEYSSRVRAVVFSSNVPGIFVAGADISEMFHQLNTRSTAREFALRARHLFSRIEQMKKPVIAAVKGSALGGGNEFIMACHYRIASATTLIGQPEISLFVVPGFGGTQRLPRLVTEKLDSLEKGVSKSLQILIGGHSLSAREALHIGLLDEVVDAPADPVSRAFELVSQSLNEESSPVNQAVCARHECLKSWSEPVPVPWELITHDYQVQNYLRQAARVGRGKAANVILKLVQLGFEEGFQTGLSAEIDAFSASIIDPEEGGKKGIPLFFSQSLPPLSVKNLPDFSSREIEQLISDGELLPVGSPFIPGVSILPKWQYAYALVRDKETGYPIHGEPQKTDRQVIIPVKQPDSRKILVYMLASEVVYEDLWPVAGIPDSVFINEDYDYYVTGSIGVGLVVSVGLTDSRKKYFQPGQLVAVNTGFIDSGVNNDFFRAKNPAIGTHQQFVTIDESCCCLLNKSIKPVDAGGLVSSAALVHRILFRGLEIKPRKTMVIETLQSGMFSWLLHSSKLYKLKAIVLGPKNSATDKIVAGGNVSMCHYDPAVYDCFSSVPEDNKLWRKWAHAGEAFVRKIRDLNNGNLPDYAISNGNEGLFPRLFQSLSSHAKLILTSCDRGVNLTYVGKPGKISYSDMSEWLELSMGQSVLLWYGIDETLDEDQTGLHIIETVLEFSCSLVVMTRTSSQAEYVSSLGFGAEIIIISVQDVAEKATGLKTGEPLPQFIAPNVSVSRFRQQLKEYIDGQYRPLLKAIQKEFKVPGCFKGFDTVIERPWNQTLDVSIQLTKVMTGKVCFPEEVMGYRYGFFGPHLAYANRKIVMPTSQIIGCDRISAEEAEQALHLYDNTPSINSSELVSWDSLPNVHQQLWEGGDYIEKLLVSRQVLCHALPANDVSTADDLICAWTHSLSG